MYQNAKELKLALADAELAYAELGLDYARLRAKYEVAMGCLEEVLVKMALTAAELETLRGAVKRQMGV